MKLFDCCNFICAITLFVILLTHTSLVNSVYQFSKSQAVLLSQVRNHSDFLKYFVRRASNESGRVAPQQGNAEDDIAEFVGCQVKDVVVSIPQPESSELFYWPLCTMAKRCTGCCFTREMDCLPVETQLKTVPVIKVRSDDSGFDHLGSVEVKIEEHVSCECQCRMLAQDCNDATHIFNQTACSCECRTIERCPPKKAWDTNTCSCVCLNKSPCEHGQNFETENCRCVPDPLSRETENMQYYLQSACRKTCPHSQSLIISSGSCYCT